LLFQPLGQAEERWVAAAKVEPQQLVELVLSARSSSSFVAIERERSWNSAAVSPQQMIDARRSRLLLTKEVILLKKGSRWRLFVFDVLSRGEPKLWEFGAHRS
jgi:hypothetical protein